MPRFLFLIVLIGGLWIVDMLAFNGQYGNAAWVESKHRGQEFRSKIDYRLRNLKF